MLRCNFSQEKRDLSSPGYYVEYSCKLGSNAAGALTIRPHGGFQFLYGNLKTSVKSVSQRGPNTAVVGFLPELLPSSFYAKYKQLIDDLGLRGGGQGAVGFFLEPNSNFEPNFSISFWKGSRVYDAVFERHADGWHLVGFP